MRFVRVMVRNFQTLENADVEFAPGLNVLFGSNDLGKSTLAAAIRAALLVPPSSSEANRYRPWFVDAVPEVTLTFLDDDDRYWQVRKRFGAASTQSTADLYYSKDGNTFSPEYQAREVDEQLRKILAWGIPSPGGKGAPRKLPTSFLSHVLLAEQTDVETIFSQSLEEDGAASGKDRLQKALAALAEDPRFKTILTQVQTKVTEYFSPSGQRKRGRESPFALAAETVKRRTERVEELKKQAVQSVSTEESIARLREAYAAAQGVHQEAAATLDDLREQQVRVQERARAEQELAAATSAVTALDRQAQEVLEHERTLGDLEAQVAIAESRCAEARQVVEAADATVREAEEGLRLASSEERERERELTRAKLDAERAKLIAQVAQAENLREALETAQAFSDSARAAALARTEMQGAAERALTAQATAKGEFTNAEQALEHAQRLLAYGHWHSANEAGKQAEEAGSKAAVLRAEVKTKEQAAQGCEYQAAQKLVEAKALRASLPDPALTAQLEGLSHDLALAEAALGGGVSIAVRGHGKIPVHVTLDGKEAIAGTEIDGRVVLEADRSALLLAGDLLDVEIMAGSANQRRALETLRERWAREAVPILTRAGRTSLPEIRELLREAEALGSAVERLEREAKQLRIEADAAREGAGVQEQRIAELIARAREATSFESKLAGADMALLATRFAELGAAWKQPAEALVVAQERAVALARDRFAQATRERDVADYRATEAAERATAAMADSARTRAALGFVDQPADPDPLAAAMTANEAEVVALSSRQAAIDEQLEALTAENTNAVMAAQQALDAAHATRESAVSAQAQNFQALQEARSQCDTTRGSAAALRAALEATDRGGADARLTAARDALEPYAGDSPMPPDALLAAEHRELEARSALDRVRRDLDQAEGALSKVGGDPLREELRREEEALDLAKEQQRDLELDSDSWKLLRETLQEAEKEGTTHLGRTLAGPVSTRLVQLTGARYSNLRLDQHLKMEGVDMASVSAENLFQALSVGTRSQIATLLRLTVAEQLKSAIILDDHLVHTDPERLEWFRTALGEAAVNTQVIVITCRAGDYLEPKPGVRDMGTRDLRESAVRAVDFARVSKRFAPPSTPTQSDIPVSPSTGEART